MILCAIFPQITQPSNVRWHQQSKVSDWQSAAVNKLHCMCMISLRPLLLCAEGQRACDFCPIDADGMQWRRLRLSETDGRTAAATLENHFTEKLRIVLNLGVYDAPPDKICRDSASRENRAFKSPTFVYKYIGLSSRGTHSIKQQLLHRCGLIATGLIWCWEYICGQRQIIIMGSARGERLLCFCLWD